VLGPRRCRVHRGIEVERPVDDAADDLTPIGHLARIAPSREAGIFVCTVSTAASTATFGSSMPSARAKPIAFWQMSRFSSVSGAIFSQRR